MLTKGERKKFVEKVAADIDAVKRHSSVLKEEAKLLSPEGSTGRFSLREKIQSMSANEGKLRAARVRLNQLERALRKIDDPEFGICFICEQAIPFESLMEMTWLTRCTQCSD